LLQLGVNSSSHGNALSIAKLLQQELLARLEEPDQACVVRRLIATAAAAAGGNMLQQCSKW
jgi:hypothetical protein